MNPTPDASLLKLLRDASLHLAADDVCAQLGWAPSQLRERITDLRSAGYKFEEHPILGIKLAKAPDRLIADDLFPRNPAARLGRQIVVYEETASTNDAAARLGRAGAAEGLVILAEKQTGGRGRLGRRWESEAGQGIYLSLVVRPTIERQHWVNLTTWAAVAVAKAVEKIVPCEAWIKWPNDIYIDGRKVVGILSELHCDKNSNPFAIVGIGVNANQAEFPETIASRATSLRLVSGKAVDRREISLQILEELEGSYDNLGETFYEIVSEAERRSFLKGRWIRLEAGSSIIEGIAGGLDRNGALQITDADGMLHSVSSGEITVSAIAIENPRRTLGT